MQGVSALLLVRVVDEVGDLEDFSGVGAPNIDDPGVGVGALDVADRVDDESDLFDLVPEFYALDYVISWIAEATMEKHLVHRFGDDWMFKSEAAETLKDWWRCGNRYEIEEFFAVKGIGPLDPEDIMNRWQKKIAGKIIKGGWEPRIL